MQHYQVIQINTKRERENWKKENLIVLYIHTFCSPFKKAYFRDLEKESRWKRVNGSYVCQMSLCNSWDHMKVLSKCIGSFLSTYLGVCLANIHLPASYHVRQPQQRSNASWRTGPYAYQSMPRFLLPTSSSHQHGLDPTARLCCTTAARASSSSHRSEQLYPPRLQRCCSLF